MHRYSVTIGAASDLPLQQLKDGMGELRGRLDSAGRLIPGSFAVSYGPNISDPTNGDTRSATINFWVEADTHGGAIDLGITTIQRYLNRMGQIGARIKLDGGTHEVGVLEPN